MGLGYPLHLQGTAALRRWARVRWAQVHCSAFSDEPVGWEMGVV